ncbi:DUF1405 domain-containing protein [Bacillus sp. FJAT-27986]|uniref:DUF1405 domain-containing protein n=1 Tax=Bacillus sp. FJAT-27986 TaxID=1743146 RepID=UPI00080AE280|nr:DUF1405 domain-containing protein [Bacillus sp. FJAT-27986]OCA83555.1 hypothetical protein A8L44_12045 [Bacillus sp. FJAT-27986]
MNSWLYAVLRNQTFLWILFTVNLLGTIYGYYWYKGQLEITPVAFLAFVPDSPTASLFFCIAVIGWLLGRNFGLFEALAIVSLFKYGIWAVVMNILTFSVEGYVSLIAVMLILSHAAMAIEGILYAPFYRVKPWHLTVAGIVVLHNEIIDYVYGMMPTYSVLNQYIPQIAYFTFWLSVLSIGVGYWFTLRKNREIYSIHLRQ